MRLITFFLLAFVLSVSANSYSQITRLSLTLENVSIVEIFESIESNSEFVFLYKNEDLDINQKRSVNLKNATIDEVLSQIFERQNVNYRIYDRQIVIGRGKTALEYSHSRQQEQTVTGIVTSANGEPLPGVTIVVKGTATGTITGIDGGFTLTLPDGAETLVFSFIGMVTQEILLEGKTVINVILEEDIKGLEEVIVVGYGTQKKANISGATSSVKMDKVLANRPVSNPAIALQGAIPGLQITYVSGEPGQSISANIRGVTSINGGSPLVLLDNTPVNFNDINPQDIESVTVLKDAAAASIYGARAAFGVVLITTKKGTKDMPIRFNYSNTFSVSQPEDIPEKATTYEFVNALQDWGVDNFWTGQEIDRWVNYLEEYKNNPSLYPNGYAEFNGLQYPFIDHDVISKLYSDSGFTQFHNFGFSGGSSKTAYRVSGGYSNQDGIVVTDNDSFKKFNLNSYLKTDLTDNLSVTINILYNNNYKSSAIGDYRYAITNNPFAPADGNHTFDDGTEVPYNTPVNSQYLSVVPQRWQDQARIFGKADYSPFKDFTITGEYTFKKTNTDNVTGNNESLTVHPERLSLNAVDPMKTFHQKTNAKTVYMGLNIYAKYKKSINKHYFAVMVGHNNEQQDYEYFRARRFNLIDVNLPALGTATGLIEADDSFYQWAVMGYFGRFNYNFKEKYFLELNARYDGSSRFASGDRWGFFPSVSAAWNMAKEDFMQNIEFINQFKWRASWGEIGNQNTSGYYPYVPGMPSVKTSWLNPNTTDVYLSLNNPSLVSSGFSWETVRTINFGLDVKWLNNRLSTSLDVYQRETLGMLKSGIALPKVLGTSAPQQNAADLKTQGFELEIGWKDKIGKFSYNIGATLFDSQAEITKFPGESGLYGSNYEGKNIGEIWGYVTDRYYTVDDFVEGTLNENLMNGTLKDGVPKPRGRTPNPGDVLFKDLNDDGEIFTGNNTLEDPGDKKIIGNNQRRYQFGLFANGEYRDFDFSVMLNGVGKRDLYLDNQVVFPYRGEWDVVFKHQLDYWTPENTEAFIPRNYPLGGVNYPFNRSTQTKYLMDGSYLRIKNITVGYTIPVSFLDKSNIQKLRIYVAAENVANFSSWPAGINTELSNKGAGATYPYLKSFSAGLNITF